MQAEPINVLLVDDDEDDFVITRELFTEIGSHRYRLEWVQSYDEALANIMRHRHDVFLVDYRLGGRTGLELLHDAQRLNGHAPMILLTGQGDQEVDLEAMRAGAADYLVKRQLTADSLDRAIRYALERKRSEEHLRRERDLISRIMETSPVGIVMTDRHGQITFANNRAKQLLGLAADHNAQSPRSVLEWRLTDIEGNPVAGRPLPLQQVLQSGRPVESARHAVERPDGGRAVLSVNATPLLGLNGEVDGMVVAVEDITERLNLEAQLRHSQKLESVGQLAAGVAHDFNNILTVILGHVGLVLMASPPASSMAGSLREVSAAAERASKFVRQLLMFSRKQVIQSRIVDLNTVLRDLGRILPSLLGEDITLEITCVPDLPLIKADFGMIEQVIMNLAVNGRDAMPRGGRLTLTTLAVDVGAAQIRQNPEARPGRFACLRVTDAGCGMDRQTLERIFEPFFSTKEVGRGTGLGLATVYGVVKQHRGWIEVQSEVSVGTTFTIYFPEVEETIAETCPAEPDLVLVSQEIRGGTETILLVEDEQPVRELARDILGQYQYRVLEAASGLDAIRIWEEYNGGIDLLITDMVMPGGLTGQDLAVQLRRRKPELRVIYSSGYSADINGQERGPEETLYLAKPYNPQILARQVRSCLDSEGKRPYAPHPEPTDSSAKAVVHVV